jgi:hypothetical protein
MRDVVARSYLSDHVPIAPPNEPPYRLPSGGVIMPICDVMIVISELYGIETWGEDQRKQDRG